MEKVLHTLFLKHHFSDKKAKTLAKVYTENTLDGINSHGINRVKHFIKYVEKGIINVKAEAEKSESFGCIERWDGHFGAGIINATKCMERAITLSKEHGIGLVALRNTNHWMRGGTYGWQAANSGCISIAFTNTQPNMPPWGGKESRLGNNPLVISIPRKEGHVVLDMAMSQFAFGKINSYKLKGEKLPFPGGWDANDKLSNDPEKILDNERGLPIGYWKGSALSMTLDMLATLLSVGNSTYEIGKNKYETGVSQIFISIFPKLFHDTNLQEKLLNEIIQYSHDVEPMETGKRTYYPGEKTLELRNKHLKEGIPVDKEIWQDILNISFEKTRFSSPLFKLKLLNQQSYQLTVYLIACYNFCFN
ncbi:3-dehydro-L-gulonate 2-dehydrogenase [Seonamhaeicola sp. S2-3]|uniref:3-dehydro-L-gulonate 2-dehydrogenase n=1 Tax=Seonamhaeicola sp. S2-3 TaxID=1936081 RepID=UPI0018DB94B0|nr:3-dehydro-L-gulonate 2-dehydrogenase [Seonamhaeicola sp. S2-3]